MSPDVSEFWKGYYSTISIEITVSNALNCYIYIYI